jgi:ribosomal protein L37AE/L43A
MATIKWQCSKCGKQIITGGLTPPQSKCPDGNYHVWSKLGRFIKQLFDLV